MNRSMITIVALAAVVFSVLTSIFIVDERTKALVMQFGQIKDVKEQPGLYFKIPFIQEVVRYDDRILGLDVAAQEVTPADGRRLIVDAFTRYRIADVRSFRRAVGAGGEAIAENRIDTIVRARLREVLGTVNSESVLSENRAELARRIRDSARAEAVSLGVEIVDVRLKRTDLPEQNLDATFARMRAEREREAADQIARGNEAAQRLRASADRTVVETVSEARRTAEIVRGEADGARTAIFAEAYSVDPEFFEFYRSLSAYRTAFLEKNSSIVMSPDSAFFDYFNSDALRVPSAASAPEAPAP